MKDEHGILPEVYLLQTLLRIRKAEIASELIERELFDFADFTDEREFAYD